MTPREPRAPFVGARGFFLEPTMNHRARANPAFTLLELVTVLALIAIASAIAVPRYASSLDNYRASLAARKVAADIAMAQAAARAASRTVTLTFDPPNARYAVAGTTVQNTPGPYTVNLSEAPFSATLQADFGGGGAKIGFDGYGTPDNPGTVRLRSGQAQKLVTVDAVTGACSIQ